jgi:20S proteasome subunit alpha 5
MKTALSCIISLLTRPRYHADPSGTFTQYDAKAIGSGSEGAQTELQDQFHKSLTLKEAQTLALKVLKQVMEEKLSTSNVQVAVVTPADGFKVLAEAELGEIVEGLSATTTAATV